MPALDLSREERFAALAQIYLELDLPLNAAVEAAEADLQQLDAVSDVAEAA
jgi:hypothetical protein